MRKLLILGALLLPLFATFTALGAGTANAAPANGLRLANETCTAAGSVQASLFWTPSGTGAQFVDVSTRNDNFASAHSSGGPFAAILGQANLTNLRPGTAYYARVRTQEGGGFVSSPTLSFTVRSCAPGAPAQPGRITAPVNLQAAAQSQTSIRFQWVPGQNNIWYCLNLATSEADLLLGGASWRNYGCWTETPNMVVTGLTCGTTYYWNVFAWNHTVNATSVTSIVRTLPCGISPPFNLQASNVTATTARLSWTPGNANIWFCVNTAESPFDLQVGGTTWRNHGCWTTATSLTVTGLHCNTVYYWNVYAWNITENTVSGTGSFRTGPCGDRLEDAPIVDVTIVRVGSAYRADIVAALPNGCYSPGWSELRRIGNRIEITVVNWVVDAQACTLIYREYETSVNLGTNFQSGQTYQVVVNNQITRSFIAD